MEYIGFHRGEVIILRREGTAFARNLAMMLINGSETLWAIDDRCSNRSDCENRHHAAACDVCALAGSRDGAASPRRVASHTAVRYAKTLRCCCFRVVTPVIMLSTKRERGALVK